MITLNQQRIAFDTFPNNETNIPNLSANQRVDNESNHILFKYESDDDLIKLLFTKKYMDELAPDAKNHLTITYMPYSRMDRSESGSAFTLKYVTQFINDMHFDTVKVIEPHSDVTVALLDRATAHYINFDLINAVKSSIHFDANQDYLFFPDAGAQKRYQSLSSDPQIVGFKHRDFESGEIKSLDIVGTVHNNPRNALIVDDLSSYGGTFVRSAKALREAGFEKIYLLIAHAEDSIFKGELFEHIDTVFTTNSLLSEDVIRNNQLKEDYNSSVSYVTDIENAVVPSINDMLEINSVSIKETLQLPTKLVVFDVLSN